jgi:predicted nucleic acid-binding Zn ribbon protein
VESSLRIVRVCPICSHSFLGWWNSRYCSDACKARAYRERRKLAIGYEKRPRRPCPMCGREFARARHARYCSPACKQRAVRLRQGAGSSPSPAGSAAVVMPLLAP